MILSIPHIEGIIYNWFAESNYLIYQSTKSLRDNVQLIIILFKIKFRALLIGSCTTMGGPKSNIFHSYMVCLQYISLIIILLFLPFILVNESWDHQTTYKEKFRSTIPNLIRISIAHPLKCLVIPQTNSVTSDRAPRFVEFHINLISNAQNPFISQLGIHN